MRIHYYYYYYYFGDYGTAFVRNWAGFHVHKFSYLPFWGLQVWYLHRIHKSELIDTVACSADSDVTVYSIDTIKEKFLNLSKQMLVLNKN